MKLGKHLWGILFVLLLVGTPLTGCGADPTPPAPSATATSGVVVSTGPAQVLALPDVGSAPLLEAIENARQHIRLKIYLVTENQVIDALIGAVERGVEVRVLLEVEPFGGGESNRLAADRLRTGGVRVRETPATFRLSHEKSLVVDDTRAFIMTHNLTRSSFSRNREYAIVSDDAAVVEEVARVFDADWDRQAVDLQESLLVWSPDNSRERLMRLVADAQNSLELQQPSMLDEEMVDQLVAAASRGVRVRLITPAVRDPEDFEFEPLARLQKSGVAVRFLDEPYVHAKAMLVDGQLAFVGSQNMTSASLDLNRELGIVFNDASAVNRLAGYFLADWEQGEPWQGPQPTPTLPADGVVPWDQAASYVGQTITVEGDIVDTYDSGNITFLNFDEDRTFTLIVFAESYQRFSEPPEDLLWRKRVRATGEIVLYRDRAEMVIEGPDQVEILADLTLQGRGPAPTLPPDGIIGWEEAGQYVGQRVTVEGDIVRGYNSGKVAFLNFTQDYESTLSVVIFSSDFDKWLSPPEEVYLGQRVQVSGKIKEYRGAPEIVVDDPRQIQVLGPAVMTPVPTATDPAAISWDLAADHVGEEAVVEGKVIDTYRSDKVIFLNFSQDRDAFKAVIFARNFDRWPQPPEELYHGRMIRVSGEILEYEGTPEVVLTSPAQVKIVE